jgi:hypothetical protein
VCYGPRIACSLGKLTNYSGFWEVDSYVQSPLASLYADVRSLAIDWLCTRGNTPLFIYFQREFRSIQTPLYVGRSLAGQLLMADISDPPDAALLKAYETVKQKSGSATPEFADLCSYTCTKFSHLFGKTSAKRQNPGQREPIWSGSDCHLDAWVHLEWIWGEPEVDLA